ncbi:hypothetical protein, partial [Nocardia brasiliensis]
MALNVVFAGRSPLGTPGAGLRYEVWTYKVTATSPFDLTPGRRVALALPADADIRDPRSYPSVPALKDMFLERDSSISRQYVGRTVTTQGPQTICFVAPPIQSDREVFLVIGPSTPGQPDDGWTVVPFTTETSGSPNNVQTLPAPARALGTSNGRPVADFAGTMPYASEIFGVYQPLAGWFSRSTGQSMAAAMGFETDVAPETFAGVDARRLDNPVLRAVAAQDLPVDAVLSPVGVVDLFRQYFFEFDTFLGQPAGHLWLSPGGTVEVVETSTRRTLTERTAEQSEESVRKTEESLTDQDDVADAVKEDNSNDTKLGASASGGANFAGIYHAEANASFSSENTTKKSSEQTHKHSRTQSSKVTSEIRRNFKTTFKTVTEVTDTTSRRYVVQNTTDKLANYELRRKMRKVGVQLQHIGTRLSWQRFLDGPGSGLGVSELVHVVSGPDLSALKKPEPPQSLVPLQTAYTNTFPIKQVGNEAPHLDDPFSRRGPDDDFLLSDHVGREEKISSTFTFTATPPAPNYKLADDIRFVSAKAATGGDARFIAQYKPLDPTKGKFEVKADYVHPAGGSTIALTVQLTWNPPEKNPAQDAYEQALRDYQAQVEQLQREAYGNAIRDRVNLAGRIRQRRSEDLRSEERQLIFANLVSQLQLYPNNSHLGAELIRQIFDVDQMLYFVAPDYWRPNKRIGPVPNDAAGRYPVPFPKWTPSTTDPLGGQTVASWYSHLGQNFKPDQTTDPTKPPAAATQESRVNYLVTESSQPAPAGSSLGWLIQLDGDERRNEFLNAAWVKVVLPIRGGREVDALAWLAKANVEGEAGLGQPYPWQNGDPEAYKGKTIGQVLDLLAKDLQAKNTDIGNTLAAEKVFETGFDPLQGG